MPALHGAFGSNLLFFKTRPWVLAGDAPLRLLPRSSEAVSDMRSTGSGSGGDSPVEAGFVLSLLTEARRRFRFAEGCSLRAQRKTCMVARRNRIVPVGRMLAELSEQVSLVLVASSLRILYRRAPTVLDEGSETHPVVLALFGNHCRTA